VIVVGNVHLKLISLDVKVKKVKDVPQLAMQALRGKVDIAPTHS
jgi:hypothetical protein